jgi:hypothetical protein
VKRPFIRYLVASPAGDVPVETHRLNYPLEADPLKTTYRIYFQAITDFISKKNFRTLLDSVNASLKTDYERNALDEIIIRAEKHGALYHPASIECVLSDRRVKFGLNVAITDTGKESLKREFDILKTLHSQFKFKYIPTPYYFDESESMVFLLEEWFDDYHEFHIAKTEDGRQQIKLWEYGFGERFLTPEQAFEIYRQAAKILTLYYDLRDFRLIYPWHHAAGDFVVKISDNNQIDVKLTTVRGYQPFMGFDEDDMAQPPLALFYFFLHLSIQMRLDKLDGIGGPVWADDFCVDATVCGFIKGLERRSDLGDCCGSARSFLMILKSFTTEDLEKTLVPIAEQFEKTTDYRLIQEHAEDHVARLYLTLQNYP